MVRSKQFGEPVESVPMNEGNDLRKRKVLRLEWKSKGVMDDESGESIEEKVSVIGRAELESEEMVRGWWRKAGSSFKRWGETYWEERSVTRRGRTAGYTVSKTGSIYTVVSTVAVTDKHRNMVIHRAQWRRQECELGGLPFLATPSPLPLAPPLPF